MITIVCQICGKQGTLDEEQYAGKSLRLKCPYCSSDFIYAVPRNGHGGEQKVVEEQIVVPEPLPPHKLVTEKLEPPAVEPPPAARSEADEAIIHEAKRIARLIISEIKLYNQDKIARARTKKEVLDMLRNDLIKGKQHYNTRVASKLPVGPDYFMESVKEILLGGKQ